LGKDTCRRTLADMDRQPPDTPELRRAAAQRDVGAIFRCYLAAGWTQRQLADATGQYPSAISEICSDDRQVLSYDTLLRIVEGLGIPRGWCGLAYSEGDEPESESDASEELSEAMKRRIMMGIASLALFGSPILGEILELGPPRHEATPLPKCLSDADVVALRGLTQALREGTRAFGGGGEQTSQIAYRSERLLRVPAPDTIASEVKSALAELHNQAGWACIDSGLRDLARSHFARAMELAKAAEDSGELASAFWHAGLEMAGDGADDLALKSFKLALAACEWTRQNSSIVAMITMSSAAALARLGEVESALRTLAHAGDVVPGDAHHGALRDFSQSRVCLALGNYDTANDFASRAIQRWCVEGLAARDSAAAEILQARLHVVTGSSDGPPMALAALKRAASTASAIIRHNDLPPLVSALSERGNSQLAQLGHQVINS
jgi:transcriptional regulator with XRE-family HTH domain